MNPRFTYLIKRNFPLFVIFLVVIVLILVIYFAWIKPQPTEPQPIERTKSQEYGAGDIGEVPGASLPLEIFSTSGIIKEIKSSYLTVEGDGTNFADETPRTLKLIFIESTKTFKPGQEVYYQGLDGLKYLEPGLKVLIGGDENIRGKTEFKVRTINIIPK